MASLDWSQCPAVESVPGKVSGEWVFRGTRMPVQTVIENLEAGMSVGKITEVFDVTLEEVRAVLHFASESLAKESPQEGGSFFAAKTIDQLIAEQGVRPAADLTSLCGALPDEDIDEMVAEIYRDRRA